MAKNVAQSATLASLDQKLAMAKRCSHGKFLCSFQLSSIFLKWNYGLVIIIALGLF